MKVICCRCKNEYPMAENFFSDEKTNRPILKCPHCGFEHIVDFIPLDAKVESQKMQKMESIDLGPYYVILYESRIADKDRADQSGAPDGDVTGWATSDEFILATAFQTNSKPVQAGRFKIQWRDVTDSGSFADVAATGEIHYTTSTTVLSDGTDVTSGEAICSAYGGDTWQNGLENENDLLCPDGAGTYTLSEDYYTEFHWALNPASAEPGHEYEFQVVDDANSVTIGTCGCTISMMGTGTDDQPCQIDVYSTDKDDQEAQIGIYASDKDDQECQIDVWSSDKDDQDAQIDIYDSGESDQDCQINVVAGDKDDQECQIDVWSSDKDDQEAQIEVWDSDKDDQPAQIEVYELGKSDQESQILVYGTDKDDQECQIQVVAAEDVDDQECQITVWGTDKDDQEAQIEVWDSDKDDQECQIEIYDTDKDDQEAQIYVSPAAASDKDDQECQILVYGKDTDDQECQIEIYEEGEGYDDQECQIEIYSTDKDDQEAQVIVYGTSKDDQECQIEVTEAEGVVNQPCQIDVWDEGTDDQPAQIDVYETGSDDQPCEILVYDWWKDDQECQIAVTGLEGFDDQEVQILIYGSALNDQECQIQVVTGTDASDQDCQIFVYGYSVSDQPVQIDIWGASFTDQYCMIEIAGPITLKGYVYDAYGTALKDVHVRLFDSDLTRVDDCQTDGQGYFELEPTTKGTYYLNVYRAGRTRVAYELDIDSFGEMWFEDKVVEATHPGEGAGTFPFAEKIEDDEGNPLSVVRVRVWKVNTGARDDLAADDRTDQNGVYAVNLTAGELYRFTYHKPRYKFKSVTRRINRSDQECQMEVVA